MTVNMFCHFGHSILREDYFKNKVAEFVEEIQGSVEYVDREVAMCTLNKYTKCLLGGYYDSCRDWPSI